MSKPTAAAIDESLAVEMEIRRFTLAQVGVVAKLRKLAARAAAVAPKVDGSAVLKLQNVFYDAHETLWRLREATNAALDTFNQAIAPNATTPAASEPAL